MGILAAQCAFARGANRVVLIDEIQFRLDHAKAKIPGLEIINFKEKKVMDELRLLFPHGPDVAIEIAGVHYVHVRNNPNIFTESTLFDHRSHSVNLSSSPGFHQIDALGFLIIHWKVNRMNVMQIIIHSIHAKFVCIL